MLRIIQIIFLVLLVQLLCCCSPSTIIVDNETVLDDDARIEWVITKADTLIDFRNGIDGFAKVGNNKISFRTSIDSV